MSTKPGLQVSSISFMTALFDRDFFLGGRNIITSLKVLCILGIN